MVLNINDLANCVKAKMIPGEERKVTIIRSGKDQNQGLAYLEDGTMIVVENGRKKINKTANIVVTSVLQTSAGRMADLPGLKKRFGSEIVFCGAIDTHQILPHGTPEQVRQEVRRVIETLGPGGGYMVSSVHTIMNDVPPENIVAMVEAVDESGKYPLE